jgi:ribonuclease HII
MEICGIDEAGRGPIAGPLVIAGCKLKKDIDGLMDSKKLTPKKREELFEKIKENSEYHIVFIDNKKIDQFGLSAVIKEALSEIMQKINANRYIFDGNSSYGIDNLEHLIKGDSKIKEISAASILAKVSRDRFMSEMDKKYPQYNFKKHKGYITKEHIELIKKYGYCEIHRKSYNVKALKGVK